MFVATEHGPPRRDVRLDWILILRFAVCGSLPAGHEVTVSRRPKTNAASDTLDLFAGCAAPPEPPDPAPGERRRPATDEFFTTCTDQSGVKQRIVAKFFRAWANVMLGHMRSFALRPKKPRWWPTDNHWRLGYVDLFSGPGRYDDGTASTPLLVIEQVLADAALRERLQTVFNDKDASNAERLIHEIGQLPGSDGLRYRSTVWNQEVTDEIRQPLREILDHVPSLYFIDPWGYRGLTQRLLNFAVSGWGNDCIFFFNFRRINMSLGNPAFTEHIDAFFGPRAQRLRQRIAALGDDSSEETARLREAAVLEELTAALQGDQRFVLPFGFKTGSGTRTSHYLIFVTKNFRGYEIMKTIMAGESAEEAGVPTFCYTPASRDFPLLHGFGLDETQLPGELERDLAGQTLEVGQIFERHGPGTPFLLKHYQTALKRLEAEGRITAYPSASARRRNTIARQVRITFPPRNGA